ncbi:hypothetical protein DFP72DRAFT_1078429 [Ephemerocybe angulata]|uniref:Uncharacterized protein n=1 Tax=Ephemerocybe angulata TaxID=980116 RepID=A0A8H6LUQ8_9AGAR|nr:hypothetical protein DFP72DRAFT_1078429 [Tulosesus angulatus]
MPRAAPTGGKKRRAPARREKCPICEKELSVQGLSTHVRACRAHFLLDPPALAQGRGEFVPQALQDHLRGSSSSQSRAHPYADAAVSRDARKHSSLGGQGRTLPSSLGRAVPEVAISARADRSSNSEDLFSTSFHPPSPPPPPPPSTPSTSRSTTPESPAADEIKVESHPSSNLPVKFFAYEAYNSLLPTPPATVHEQSGKPDWAPFRTKADFKLAEFMQNRRFKKGDIDALLELFRETGTKSGELTLVDSKDVEDLWKAAVLMHDSSLKKRTFVVPYKNSEIEYDIWMRDLWDWCLELLHDPFHVRAMHWHAQRLYRHNGQEFERFINEPWTADDWWDIQSALPANGFPFMIILYADKTKLSTMGTQKGYPVYARCANFTADLRNGKGLAAGRLVGWLPIVPELAEESGKRGFVDFKRVVWHSGFQELLATIKMYSKTGFPVRCGDGIERLIFPIILILSADYEEQCMMAAIRGVNSSFPCPTCLVPLAEMADMTKTHDIRISSEMQNVYLSVKGGPRAAQESALKAKGLRNVENVFWDLEYTDVYRAISWDRLHAYHGGLFSDHLLEQVLEILDSDDRNQSSLFESQLAAFPRWRDLNHFTEIAQFREFTDGRKYEDLSKQIIYASHNVLAGPSSGQAERGYALLRLIRCYLDLDLLASLRNHSESTLAMGQEALNAWDHELKEYRKVWGLKSWEFPKAHTHQHLFNDIRKKGVTRNSNTKTFETMHGTQKDAYDRTNFKNIDPQIAKLNAFDHACFLIRQKIDRSAALAAELKAQAESQQDLNGRQVPDTVGDTSTPTHLVAGSPIDGVCVSELAQHFPHEYADVFRDISKKISSRLAAELGHAVLIPGTTRVSVYRYVKVDYASYENSETATDFLRMNQSFHGRQRYDFGLFSIYGGNYIIGQLIAVLGVHVNDIEYLVAIILPCDEPLTGGTAQERRERTAQKHRDRALGFHRVRRRPRKQDSVAVLARTLVRRALMVPDFGDSLHNDEFLVVDVVDADMWLRMKSISGLISHRRSDL